MNDYSKMAKNLKVRIRTKEFFLEKRTGKGDRRKAFFSHVENDRRKKCRRHDDRQRFHKKTAKQC